MEAAIDLNARYRCARLKLLPKPAGRPGFEVIEVDPKDGYEILDGLSEVIVMPILHGKNGEDGIPQAELEKRGLPFLGSTSSVSKICIDKWQTRLMLQKAGIAMPKAEHVHKGDYLQSELAKQPHVLKVQHGGSSIGTLMVRDPAKVTPEQIEGIFSLEDEAVLEELIEGIEITIPIFDQSALPALEVCPPEGGEFDYENKYNGQSAELCPPLSLSAEQHQAAQALAEKVHSTHELPSLVAS